MRVSTAAYPWDVSRLSVPAVLDELEACGIECLDVSATYHPIDALSPRGDPVSLFSTGRGGVFFPAHSEGYGAIRPLTTDDQAVLDVWARLADEAAARRIELRPWVIALFQPWIADRYGEFRRVLANGQYVAGSVCPRGEAVREYLVALCADVIRQCRARTLRLEGVALPDFTHQWGRPRVLVELSPLARRLLALCFCASCCATATNCGLDVRQVRQRVVATVRSELERREGAQTAPAPNMAQLLAADEELRVFIAAERQCCMDLVRAVSSASNGAGPTSVLLSTSPRDRLHDWDPMPVAELIGTVDGVIVDPLRNPDLARYARDTADCRARILSLCAFVTCGDGAGAASLGPAGAGSGAELQQQLEAADAIGVDEINLYNFGLVQPAALASAAAMARTVGGVPRR
jgi:hypothetical protein